MDHTIAHGDDSFRKLAKIILNLTSCVNPKEKMSPVIGLIWE